GAKRARRGRSPGILLSVAARATVPKSSPRVARGRKVPKEGPMFNAAQVKAAVNNGSVTYNKVSPAHQEMYCALLMREDVRALIPRTLPDLGPGTRVTNKPLADLCNALVPEKKGGIWVKGLYAVAQATGVTGSAQ